MCSEGRRDSLSVVVCVALEGFSYVPQLHPLETLHNTLTYREVDDFLGRITTTRFTMPAISPTIAANRPLLMLVSPDKCEYARTPHHTTHAHMHAHSPYYTTSHYTHTCTHTHHTTHTHTTHTLHT